jgi:hypothetical protein
MRQRRNFALTPRPSLLLMTQRNTGQVIVYCQTTICICTLLVNQVPALSLCSDGSPPRKSRSSGAGRPIYSKIASVLPDDALVRRSEVGLHPVARRRNMGRHGGSRRLRVTLLNGVHNRQMLFDRLFGNG